MNKTANTITDRQGRTTEIDSTKRYAILYFAKGYNEMRIDQGAYLNYGRDGYIGHDDCEGRANGPRFVFDGIFGEVFHQVPKDHIYGVMPVDEFEEKMVALFA